MRDIIRKVYCDRCGKELSAASYRHSLTITLDKGLLSTQEALDEFLDVHGDRFGDVRDFCADCTKSFYEWMKQGKQENRA